MLRAFPLPIIVVILYNLVAFGWLYAGHNNVLGLLSWGLPVALFSGDVWTFTGSDLLLLSAFSLLFVEIVKSTRAASREIVKCVLSLITFGAALAEFLLLRGFATSVFFFIMLMTLFDLTARFAISTRKAERNIDMNHSGDEP